MAVGPAVAQETVLSLDVGASYSLPPAGGTGIATTYANGGLNLAGLFGAGGYFRVGGSGGLALTEEGASWGAVRAEGGWLQPLSAVFSLGISGIGEAFTVGDPLPYRAAYAVGEPEIRFVSGGTVVRLKGYGGLGSSEVTAVRTFVRDTRFGPRQYTVGYDVASDLWAWGGGAEIGQQFAGLSVRAGLEGYDSPQGPYTVGRLGLDVSPPGGSFYVEGAIWDTPDGREAVLVAGLRVHTGGPATFLASGGRYGPDPLLDSPAAGGVGAVASLELARLGPKPELTWTLLQGMEPTLVLTLRVPGASIVECTGDFTNWERVPMLGGGDEWSLVLPVQPGAFHFGFFVNGEWYVPADSPGLTEDEWGQLQATILITDSAVAPDVTP
jgi:hypothetical protein